VILGDAGVFIKKELPRKKLEKKWRGRVFTDTIYEKRSQKSYRVKTLSVAESLRTAQRGSLIDDF